MAALLLRLRRPLLAAALAALGFASRADRSEAYRLFDNGAADRVVASDQAVRWAPDIWGPGSNLSFRIAAAPGWTTIFRSAAEVASAAEEGLAEWGNLPTADIRWSVSSAPGAPQGTWTRDGASSVFYNSEGGEFERGAGVWYSRDPARAVWDIAECDIAAPRSWALEFEGFSADQKRFAAAEQLAGWFAPCLGLGASARLPSAEGAGGFGTPWNVGADRNTGASLLRPGSGWLDTVGSISGTVTSDGEPASYSHVWAFPTSGSPPIGAFANRSGAFRIEGLPPGGYVLWAHPISGYDHRMAGAGAVTDVQDTVLALPVTVAAGRNTGGHRISMRRGR